MRKQNNKLRSIFQRPIIFIDSIRRGPILNFSRFSIWQIWIFLFQIRILWYKQTPENMFKKIYNCELLFTMLNIVFITSFIEKINNKNHTTKNCEIVYFDTRGQNEQWANRSCGLMYRTIFFFTNSCNVNIVTFSVARRRWTAPLKPRRPCVKHFTTFYALLKHVSPKGDYFTRA